MYAAHASPVISQLIKLARSKVGFVDPSGVGAGGPPPGGDPAAMGGAPPPGMDPAAMGGAPPMDPAAMGGGAPPPPPAGGGGDPLSAIMDKLNQMVAGGGGGAGGPPMKPKIDVNVEIMQMKNMLAKLLDASGIPISAQEMTATPEKLQQMAAGGGTGTPGTDPATAGGGGAQPPGAIPAIEPIQPATKSGGMGEEGFAYGPIETGSRGMNELSAQARAVALLMGGRED